LRILVIHSTYRSGPASGENRVVEDEARLLSEGGHQVDVFAPQVSRADGIMKLATGLRLVWSPGAAYEVGRRVERQRPDIVHCHNMFPALSPAVLRATADVPVVLTLHNYRLLCLPSTFLRNGDVCEDCLGRVPWPGVLHGCYQGSHAASALLASSLLLHREIGTFDRIRRYIAISEFVRRKHVDAGVPPDQIVVKPHFAWPVERREGPGDYFLYLGRLSAEKGVSTLLDTWKGVKSRLLVVGDGPERGRLMGKGLPNVEFKATVGPDEVPALLRGARAVLSPSVSHEGAGRVVLEAYAAGVRSSSAMRVGFPKPSRKV